MTAGVPPAATIVDGLARQAIARRDAPVWVSSRRVLTFGELHARIAACARWLRDAHVERGEVIGVSVADELTHIVVAVGLAAAGAAHLVLPTFDAATARARLAERVGVRRVVATGDDHWLPGAERIALEPDRAEAWSREAPTPLASPDPASLLTFFTSSGTTGEAKIIPTRHDDFMLQVARARVGRVLSLASVEQPIGKRQYLHAIALGTSVVERPPADTPIVPLCTALAVTQIACNAARAREVMGEAARHGRLPPFTELTASGARTSATFRRQLLENVCDAVHVTYSMQECGSVARTVERSGEATDGVGPPNPGVEVAILDGEGRSLPRGEIGEIAIRARGMARGYLGDDAANAKHFRDGWFRPGDLGSLGQDGALVVHGRADDVMILNGIKIAPAQIERTLERHPAVKAVVAFPLPSAMHGQLPVAAVEVFPGATVDEKALQRYARDALGLAAPRRVVIVPALPSTVNDKVDVRSLVEAMKRGTL